MIVRQKTREILIHAPYDIYGHSAHELHALLTSCGGVEWIQKSGSATKSDASSLLHLLRMGVREGEMLRVGCKACEFDTLVENLHRLGDFAGAERQRQQDFGKRLL